MTADKKPSCLLDTFLLYSPVLIAILVMLPRLLSPQFGLLDDGKSIITSQDIANGSWNFRFDVTDSRFRPFYWLSFAIPYIIFGERPFWYFLLNALVLCLTVAALIVFLHRDGAKRWQAWLAGMFFVLAGSVIENFYTLSKGEWLQVMFIAASLVAISFYTSMMARSRKTLTIAGSSLLLLCAMLSKETSVVILPVSAAWAALGWIWAGRTTTLKPSWRTPYLVSAGAAVVFYFILRFIYTSSAISTSGYTERYSLAVSQLMASIIRWAGWLVRDYSYLLVLFLLLIVLIIIRKEFPKLHLALDMLIWIGAWVAVYLPWNYMTEYYMLPFAFGAAAFAGLVLGEKNTWQPAVPKALAVISLVLFVVSFANNLTSARIQLAVDDANAKMINALDELPPGSRIFVNIQSANEYTDQIAMQLTARFGRDDLEINLFEPGLVETGCITLPCFIISPVIQNQPLLTVRMGVHQPTQEGWNTDLQDYLEKRSEWARVWDVVTPVDLMMVDFPRLFCAIIKTRAFCATSAPVIDTRLFQYGWTIYQKELP